MNKTIRSLQILALTLGIATCSARADSFSYSYLFGDGLRISGTIEGTASGNFVEDVSSVTLWFNGVQAPGSVYLSRFDGASYLSGPVVSFDAQLNNFFFADSDLANGDFAYNSIFYILNGFADFDAAFALAYPLDQFGSQDSPVVSGSWTLSHASVPDAGPTAVMLGLAVAGLSLFRREPRGATP